MSVGRAEISKHPLGLICAYDEAMAPKGTEPDGASSEGDAAAKRARERQGRCTRGGTVARDPSTDEKKRTCRADEKRARRSDDSQTTRGSGDRAASWHCIFQARLNHA